MPLSGPSGIRTASSGGAFSDLFDAGRLTPAQVDAELLRSAEDLLVGLLHLDRRAVAAQDLDVETQGLHLLEEDLERLRDARVGDVLALDDGLVDLHAAGNVVRLDRQQLLERVGGAVRLEGPDLHLTEALATELGLTAERLLGDHGVRTGRTSVDLVVDEVVELEDVHVADGDGLRERLAGAAVEQARLARGVDEADPVARLERRVEQTRDDVLGCTVEDRRRHARARRGLVRVRRDLLGPLRAALDLPAARGGPAEVQLEDLAEVHTTRHTVWVEHDVDRRAVLEERHVLDREDLGDDALVAVAAGELVTVGDLALVGHVDADELVDAGRQVVAQVGTELLDADDRAGLAVGHLEARVADLARLLTEDRAQQALLRRQLGLALGRDLADQDVAGRDVGTDADDAALVEVGEDLLADVRDVAGDLLRAELGVAGVDLVLLDVDRGEHVALDDPAREDDRVLVVVAFPRHERDEQVLAEGHLALVGARAVGDDLAGVDAVALVDDHALVEARALVGATEFRDLVGAARAVVVHDGDVLGRRVLHDTRLLGDDHVAGVDRRAELLAGADER